MLCINVRKETLQLWPERALFWPRKKTLIITDPHFGKASSFRYMGIPIPQGVGQDDLVRLERMLEKTKPKQLVILGDFYHNRNSRTDALHESLQVCRDKFPCTKWLLIQGNHDLHAGEPPQQLGIQVVTEPYKDGPLLYSHTPQEFEDGYVLAGHIHPGVRLYEPGGGSLRFPCFLFSQHYALLPAFTHFAGMQNTTPKTTDRIFLVHEDQVLEWK